MNLQDKKTDLKTLMIYHKGQKVYFEEHLKLAVNNFIKKINAESKFTKNKIFRILKEEFGDFK